MNTGETMTAQKAKAAGRSFSGDALREARELAGLTQLQLAIAIGKTPGTIANWEAGRTVPDAADLTKLEGRLPVKIEALFE